MSHQIKIAQSTVDEGQLVAVLMKHDDLVALPRMHPSRDFRTTELGQCDAEKQVICLKKDISTVLAHIGEAEDQPGTYLILRHELEGRIIEWNRTKWITPNKAAFGRFFFATKRSEDAAARKMQQIMVKLQRHIRAEYLLRSKEPRPIYIGPDMALLVRDQQVQITYEGGTPIDIVQNG